MKVNFNLFKSAISWESHIHQLNSDILLRHVLMYGNVENIHLAFSYCEESREGSIKNRENEIIGNFAISF
ncbi:hypothetical protein L4C36_10505 [Photobacterium japonica]